MTTQLRTLEVQTRQEWREWSNGNPHEQALIRRWGHRAHGGRGRALWEYPLSEVWMDAIWFPEDESNGVEEFGLKLPARFPLNGKRIWLCEAKNGPISPSLIGQALVYDGLCSASGRFGRANTDFRKFGDERVACCGG